MQEDQKTNEDEKIIEEKDWSTPDFIFLPKGNHLWRQEGPYIICRSCELVHATYIGTEKVLIGLKESEPIFKTRKELGFR